MKAVMKPKYSVGKNGIVELYAASASKKVENANALRPNNKRNILVLVKDGSGFN